MNTSLNVLSGKLPPCHQGFLLCGFILFFCLERFPLFHFDGMPGAGVDVAQESQGASNDGTHRHIQPLRSPQQFPVWQEHQRLGNRWFFFPCIVQVLFKLLMFCCVPGSVSLHLGSLAISLPSARHCTGSGVPTGTVSPCLSYQFRCGPSICSSCLVSLQIFRRNCSICRCRLVC